MLARTVSRCGLAAVVAALAIALSRLHRERRAVFAGERGEYELAPGRPAGV